MERIDPINLHDDDPRDEERFQCACGDANCWGFNTDADNIRLGSAWYAADCQMVKHHPVIVAEREQAALADVARDDAFNRTRR